MTDPIVALEPPELSSAVTTDELRSDELANTPTSWRRAVKRFVGMPVPMAAFLYIVLLLILTFFGHLIANHDPIDQTAHRFAGLSGNHWLGTDDLGRDTFSRLVVGTQVSIRSGFQAILQVLIIAMPIGLLAGYVGGKIDLVILRVMDAINSFPGLVSALAIASVLGPGLNNTIIAITFALIPGLVRLVRAQTLALREETYVEASRAIGTPIPTILRKRIVPGVLSPVIVATSLQLGYAILLEASLTFLGMGAQPPNPSWGNMLQRAFVFIFTEPLQVFIPAVAIALAILSFNLFGDGLRDALSQIEVKPPKGVKRGRLGLTSVKDATPETTQPAGTILAVQGLTVEFATPAGPLTVVTDVTFDVKPGEIVGLVGESGCGKSVTSSAIMRLIASPPGRITSGRVLFDGRDLLPLPFAEMRKIRGNDIAMVFQDPMSSLNPAFTIGNQLVEAIQLHREVSKADAETRATELLDLVGIPDARSRLKEYPHHLSGGMRQRVLIAMALVNDPKLVIADEPTTALDVTVQAQILELLKKLQREFHMAMILVTHDLGVVADICDRVAVMYAGEIVEQASVHELFANPRHPYTKALLGAIPQLAGSEDRLTTIPGVVPVPSLWPKGCRFSTRCEFVTDQCTAGPVPLEAAGAGQLVRCVRHDELAAQGAKVEA
ncbi:MAG: dipeptide/oligopeptide/nickel ABC transporter permease/ATP-binding protein [Acidobacteria bacterium]|nr:dipeptide/oligopeptide/nickel ABC transporter permease/ATP-binding protein [Acidobacteriota bacterium]